VAIPRRCNNSFIGLDLLVTHVLNSVFRGGYAKLLQSGVMRMPKHWTKCWF